MAWTEWEELKAAHAPTGVQLNMLADDGGGSNGTAALPATTGVLKVDDEDLSNIGRKAHTLYDGLWNKARVSLTSTDSAATDLDSQGFALGSKLQQISSKWDEQLSSLMGACAHISNHLQVTKKVHAGDESYIQRQVSSIETLGEGFDSRSEARDK